MKFIEIVKNIENLTHNVKNVGNLTHNLKNMGNLTQITTIYRFQEKLSQFASERFTRKLLPVCLIVHLFAHIYGGSA